MGLVGETVDSDSQLHPIEARSRPWLALTGHDSRSDQDSQAGGGGRRGVGVSGWGIGQAARAEVARVRRQPEHT